MDRLSGKRLLFVITKSNWGGAQSYVYTLARKAREEGADVLVALGGTGLPGSETGMLAAKLTSAGIRIVVIPSFAREVSLLREWRAFRELLALFRKEKPDILHLNSSKAGGIGALAGRIARVPRIVFTAHGWAHREPRGFLMRLFIVLSSWATIVLSHKVIAVSAFDRRDAPVLFSRKKIGTITIGVDAFPLVSRDEARSFLAPETRDLQKLPTWIMVLAELTKNKGIDNAIRAFAGVSTNIDHAALVIVSEGEEHGRLLELIDTYHLKKRVFLLGFVPDAKRYLKAADLFLLPSRKEGFPLTLLEAGHAGLPVIASAVGGVPEIIDDGKTGLLVPPNDLDALADTMTRLLTSPEGARSLGDALQTKVTTRFSEEEMLVKTLDVYTA